MNTLTIIVIVYLVLAMTRGFFHGFVKTLFSMIFFAMVIVTALFLAKPMTSLVSGSKNVTEYVEAQSEQFLRDQSDQISESESGDGSSGGLAIAILGSAMRINGIRTIAAERITEFLLNIIGFLAALVISAAIWITIEIILNILTRNHIIGPINRTLGLVFGLFRGLIIVWIVFGVISTLQFTGLGGELQTQIRESLILTTINRYNLIAQLLPDFLLSLI